VIARLAIVVALAACSGDAGRGARDGAPRPGDGTSPGYKVAVDGGGKVAQAGEVNVVVSWAQPTPASLGSPGRNACGAASRVAVDAFIRDKRETVTAMRYAVVELVGVERGRAAEAAEPLELSVRDCRVHPVVARLGRLGAPLALINDDERRHEVVVEHLGDGTAAPTPIATVPLPLVGQRVELGLPKEGIVRITTASDEHDHVYVAVPGHPYVALADATGLAKLEQVPAGKYQVRVWHPPLTRGGAPLVATASVVVEAGKAAELVIPIQP
jgi:hypothetical protein